jgi:hypothetical protein
MNIETRKYNLINWITKVNNERIIEYLELFKMNENDPWDELPENVKFGISKSLE